MELTKEGEFGSYLALLRRKQGMSRQALARICVGEFEQGADRVKDYIRRLESGRKQVIKPKDRERIKVIIKKLGVRENEALEVFEKLEVPEMVELGLLYEPTAVISGIDEIVRRLVQLKYLLKRYGIDPTVMPLDTSSSSSDLQSQLCNLKESLQQSPDDIFSLLESFSSARVPINRLLGGWLRTAAHNKIALIARIDSALLGMESAKENLARVGVSFLDGLTRIDGLVLADFNSAWLAVLEKFQSAGMKTFPPIAILESRGRILSWEDTYQWEKVSRKYGWKYVTLPCERDFLEKYTIEMSRKGHRFVLAVGAEVVALDGTCLANPGIRLLCQKAKENASATVAVAAETFRIHKFKVNQDFWGIDRYRQPFTLDTLTQHEYSVVITDDGIHWTEKPLNLACCAQRWETRVKQNNH